MTNNFLKHFKQSRERKSKSRFYRTFSLALVCLFLVFGVYAAISDIWTTNSNQSASTVVNGVTINWSGTPGPNIYANGTFNSIPFWTDPWTGPFGGGTALDMTLSPYGTNRTITVTFSQPVDNPVLHVDRIGSPKGNTVSTSVFTLGSFSAVSPNVTISQLSGNPAFYVNPATKSFQRAYDPYLTVNNRFDCQDTINFGTGCGSVQFNGTGITSLTFNVTWDGIDNGTKGDDLLVRWSVGGGIVVKKQSVNTTGTYNFSGTNGVGNFSLNTATANPATSAYYSIADNSQNITITEASSPGTVLSSATCRDSVGNIIPSSLSNLTLTLTPANYANLNQIITCTFVNSFAQPELRITKSNNAPWTVGGAGAVYSLNITNIGTQAASGTVTVRDTLPNGIAANWTGTRSVSSNGINWSCTFTGQNITCSTANSLNYTGTNSSVISLPVNISVAANTGTPIVNYASVGGGGDPYNGGTAPAPGAGCSNANHCASNSVTITNQPPDTNNINTPAMQNTWPATGIPALSGSDPDGSVMSFRINSLPAAAAGTLYLCSGSCAVVSVGQIIPAAQAANLQFDPLAGFSGNAVFNYSAIDNLGLSDPTPATYTIPIGQPPNVGLIKSCPVPATCISAPQIAGTVLTYSIQFTNSGGQPASGLIIVDAMPGDSDYLVNSAAVNAGTTGVTFVIEYSNDYNPGNPAAATWTYTPVSAAGGAPPGYDRLTKAIRWRATAGLLSNTSPNNTGDMSFRVRIR